MSVVRWVVAASFAAGAVLSPAGAARAGADAGTMPTSLVFAGADLWRYGDFLYGGTLWSPDGLDRTGFTLKLLVNGGRYSYDAGSLATTIDGTLLSGAALPGWRFVREALTVTLFAGAVVQDYRLAPFDPGSRLHGLYTGAQLAGDVWYQPTRAIMAAVNGSLSSIGPTGTLRGALGYRVFAAGFVGPEAAMLWCGNFQEFQLGAHVTGLRMAAAEWSAAAGFAADSDRRSGPYLRLGWSARY